MNTLIRFFLAFSVLFLLGSSRSFAQLSMAEFLLSVKSDFDLTSFEEQIRYLDNKPYRLSPLQKVEFRTKNNQLDPSRQDYGLRFTPANPWELKNNNLYFKQYRSVLSLEKELAFKDALIIRYNLIISMLYYSEIKAIKEEDRRLINAQVSILEKQRHSDFFNAEDYIELKLDQMDKTVEFEEATFELDNQLRKMVGVYPAAGQKQIDWRYENILSIERLENVVDSLFGLSSTPVTLTYRDNQIDLANREYQLEKSNINVGFLQTQYEEYRTEQDRKPWSISLGVTIPITNPNKGDMTKRKLEVIEAQHERDETNAELETNKIVTHEQLKSLLARYRDIHEKIMALNTGTLSSTLNAIKDDNPMATVRFNGNLLKLKSIEAKLKQSILITYIQFLGYTDMIQQQPLINYLSEELDTLG